MEQHFKVRMLDEAIAEAVRLSARYISGRQLPDKAIGVLDTACAKVALGQSATPARDRRGRKRLERLHAEARNLQVRSARRRRHDERLAELRAQRRRWKPNSLRLQADEAPGAKPSNWWQRSSACATWSTSGWAVDGRGRRNGPAMPRPRARDARSPACRPRPVADPELLASCKQAELAALQGEAARWCRCRWTATWWPRSSRPGPASRWARWSRTRSAPCWTWAHAAASA
jgi:type VI secretion system protein VasG